MRIADDFFDRKWMEEFYGREKTDRNHEKRGRTE